MSASWFGVSWKGREGLRVRQIVLFITTAALLSYIYRRGFWARFVQSLNEGERNLFDALAFFLGLSAIAGITKLGLNYLNTPRLAAESVDSLMVRLSEVERNVRSQAAGITPADRVALAAAVNDALAGELASTVITKVEEAYRSQIGDQLRLDLIREGVTGSNERLVRELQLLGRRGNLNLVIGTVTTGLAAMVLAYTSLKAPIGAPAAAELLAFFIPRLGVVIFVEVFAFFFLRLYKANLDDAKYYQRELLSLDLKSTALMTALVRNDEESIKRVIGQFARGEPTNELLGIRSEAKGMGMGLSLDIPELTERVLKVILRESGKREGKAE